MVAKLQLHLSDWVALAIMLATMPFSVAASLIWFEQGMAYSATVGIETASGSRGAFACRADGAFWIAILALGLTFTLRFIQLWIAQRVGFLQLIASDVSEHSAIFGLTLGTMA